MKRRDMLKSLGFSIGAIALTPGIGALLQSCTEEKAVWTPDFFSIEEGDLVTKIVDVILPKTTDLPSASEVNVPQFIDRFANEVIDPKQHPLFKKGLQNLTTLMLKSAGKENSVDLNEADVEKELSRILKKTKEEHDETMTTFYEYVADAETNPNANVDDEVLNYVCLENMRGLVIWGYKSSEKIAKEVLKYVPVPGEQRGCVDIQEASGGRAYALGDW